MRKLLLKLGIINFLDLTLDIRRSEFVEKLNKAVEPGKTSGFNGLSEVFSRDPREYVGSVEPSGFQLKQKRRAFSFNKGIATAKGEFTERNGKLNVKVEINGIHKTLKILIWLLVAFYAIGISFVLFLLIQKGDLGFLAGLLGILVHAVFMFGIFFLLGRAGAKKMKYDLERELFFIAKAEK